MKSQYAGGLGGWAASWENEVLKERVYTGRAKRSDNRKTNFEKEQSMRLGEGLP
jgi:hypothetical protein